MARKALGLLLSLCLVMGLGLPLAAPSAAAQAAEGPAFSVTTTQTSIKPGETLTVSIQAEGLTDIYAYELNLYYDHTLLELDPAQRFTDQTGFALPLKVSSEGGSHVKLVYTRTGTLTGMNGSATLGRLTFRALKEGSAELILREVKTSTSSLKEEKLLRPNAKAQVTIQSDSVPSDPTPGSPTTGPADPTPNPTANQPSPSPAPAVLEVKEEQLQNAANRKVTLTLPTGGSQLNLPINTGSLLGANSLVLKYDSGALDFPSVIFNQLLELVKTEDRTGSTINLKLVRLQQADESRVLEQASQKLGAAVKLGTGIYDFQLTVVTTKGTTAELTEFTQPVTVTFRLPSAINPRLSSVFYIPEQGGPEFIGGSLIGDELIAHVSHFSAYTVLEIHKTFSDIPDGHWAANVIKELAAKQIINGVSAHTFDPAAPVSRAQFTVLLARSLKLNGTSDARLPFDDVHSSDWFATELAAAVHAGLIKGRSPTRFEPHAQISREEMAVMLVRAYKLLKPEAELPTGEADFFTDTDSISSWAVSDIRTAAALGLIQGRAAGQFVPQGIFTRAEAAQVLYRLVLQ